MIKPAGIRLLVFVCSFVLQTGCIGDNNPEQEGADITTGDRLPSLNLTLSDGTVINDEYLTGKTSLLLLFTTTCSDCMKQLPDVDLLYREMKDDNSFVLFGISREQSEDDVRKYWIDNNLALPYSAQADRQVYELFARSGVPRIYIANEERIVTFTSDDNPIASYDNLKKAIEAAGN